MARCGSRSFTYKTVDSRTTNGSISQHYFLRFEYTDLPEECDGLLAHGVTVPDVGADHFREGFLGALEVTSFEKAKN